MSNIQEAQLPGTTRTEFVSSTIPISIHPTMIDSVKDQNAWFIPAMILKADMSSVSDPRGIRRT